VMAKAASQPDGTPPPTIDTPRKPYERCEGLYPWFIYRNLGNGTFAPTATVKYQPVPLESASGDSNFSGPMIASESRAIMDFDGDGWQDAIVRDTGLDGNGSLFWQVFRGDGTGGFTGKSYRVPTRPINCLSPQQCGPGDNAISGIGGVFGQTTESSRGLLDFNGDGLVDHWKQLTAGNADIAFFDGERFALFGTTYPQVGDLVTPVTPNALKPGNDAVVTVDPTNPPGNQIVVGSTSAQRRVTDVDGDGRADLVAWPPGGSVPTVYFNVGGQLNPLGPSYYGDATGATRKTIAANPGLAEDRTWRLESDLLDLDGDGRDKKDPPPQSNGVTPNGATAIDQRHF